MQELNQHLLDHRHSKHNFLQKDYSNLGSKISQMLQLYLTINLKDSDIHFQQKVFNSKYSSIYLYFF